MGLLVGCGTGSGALSNGDADSVSLPRSSATVDARTPGPVPATPTPAATPTPQPTVSPTAPEMTSASATVEAEPNPTSPPGSSVNDAAATVPDPPTGINPVRIRIAAIGVDAAVIPLDIRGEPEVPEDFAEVGWYQQTRLPGEIGPAVVAGHIDSRDGPAVFIRLDQLTAGDEVEVEADDGETRTFVVTDWGQYAKTALPPEVFGFGDPLPELRLITCGGTFDSGSGHYRDNFVVYASDMSYQS